MRNFTKINRGFTTLVEQQYMHLKGLDWGVDSLKDIYQVNHFPSHVGSIRQDPITRYSPIYNNSADISTPYLIRGLQPWISIAKDFTDINQRYKSSWYIKRDILSPIYGLINIAHGCINLLGGVLYAIFCSIALPFLYDNNFINISKEFLTEGLTQVIDGLSRIFHGMVQIITFPLTWLIKLPIRLGITLSRGYQPIEEGTSLNRLGKILKEEYPTSPSYDIKDKNYRRYVDLENECRRKIFKAERRGQSFKNENCIKKFGLFCEEKKDYHSDSRHETLIAAVDTLPKV